MTETTLDKNAIKELRKKIEMAIYGHDLRLRRSKKELENLQENCPHPDKHSRPEYDFTAYWCDDCGKDWSTRR